MVFVVTGTTNVEIAGRRIGKGLEKMKEEFGGYITDPFTAEFSIPNEPWSPSEIYAYMRQAVVHGQVKTIALQAFLVAQRLTEGFTQCQCRVFDRMVFIHFQISVDFNGKIYAGVPGDLVQHVIKETQPSGDDTLAGAIQVELDQYIGFFGGAAYFDSTCSKF